MTERWRSGLQELSRVPMSDGLLERAAQGSRMADPGRPDGARRVATIAVALVIFAAGALGAWVALRPSAPSARPSGAGETSQRVYGTTVCIYRSTPGGGISATSGMDSTSDPVSACEEHRISAGVDIPRPVMMACVNPEYPAQITVVEVGSSPDGMCSGLGFTPLPDGWDGNLAEWRATEEAAASVFPQRTNGVSCLRDGQTAVDSWRSALDDHGFTSWEVVLDDNNAGWPCFEYKVNYDSMEITIVHNTP